MRLGCQTCTWEMFGEPWLGRVDDILDAIASAGFEGIEIGSRMTREYATRARELAVAAHARGLAVAAYAFAPTAGWLAPGASEENLRQAGTALRFAQNLPGALLVVGSAPRPGPGDSLQRIAAAAEFYNEVGRRGGVAGVAVAFRCESSEGSDPWTDGEYERILAMTDPATVGWAADVARLFRDGADVLQTLRRYRSRLKHIYLRDVDRQGAWRPVGQGICGVPRILSALVASNYDGWTIVEEQSVEAWTAPDRMIVIDAQYVGRYLYGG
jgi:inosose dehydratase